MRQKPKYEMRGELHLCFKKLSSVNDIRIKKSGMEILIPADLEQYQLKNILTVLASI